MDTPAIRYFAAEISQTLSDTPGARHYRVRVPGFSGASPGAHVLVRLPGSTESYPYSLATEVQEGEDSVELLIGRNGSARFLAELSRGARLEVSDARGAGLVLRAGDCEELWLVGNGTGVAPLRAIAAHYLRVDVGRLYLVHGARTEEELYFRREFESAADRIVYCPVVSQPSHEWKGLSGHVQGAVVALLDGHPKGRRSAAALCGARAVVDETLGILRLRLGLSPEHIFAEGY